MFQHSQLGMKKIVSDPKRCSWLEREKALNTCLTINRTCVKKLLRVSKTGSIAHKKCCSPQKRNTSMDYPKSSTSSRFRGNKALEKSEKKTGENSETLPLPSGRAARPPPGFNSGPSNEPPMKSSHRSVQWLITLVTKSLIRGVIQ